MPLWKTDLVFQANGRGWQETYYKVWPGPGFASVTSIVQALAQKRIALSGSPVFIKAYRITDPLLDGVQGQAVYFTPPIVTPTGAGADGSTDPGTSIVTSWRVDAGESGRRIWLRGVWDSAINNFGTLQGGPYADWFAKFQVYRNFVLQNGFGWLTRARIGNPTQVKYDYDLDPIIPTFTFATNFFTLTDVGKYQTVRFSKFNSSRSPLNRELVVYVTSQTQCIAAEPITAGPMINPGRCIKYATPTFVAADAIVVDRVGRRNPGAPLLLTPGRRRNRARS